LYLILNNVSEATPSPSSSKSLFIWAHR
jgi:hypothetical protein